MAKITGVVTKVDAKIIGGVPIQNKIVAADINEIVEVVNLNSDISDNKADLVNGKLDVNQLPDLAITSVIIASEATLTSFASNSINYTFEQGDVIILDNGNGTFFMYNGGDKSLNDSYNEISSTEIDWSQVVNTPTTIGGYNISDAYTKTEVDGLVSDSGGALEFITEGGNTGIAIKGRNSDNYGITGDGAIDLSFSSSVSTTKGATGNYSLVSGINNTGSVSSLVSGENNIGGTYSLVSGKDNEGGIYSLVSGRNNVGNTYSLVSGQNNEGSLNSIVSGVGNTGLNSIVSGQDNEGSSNSIVSGVSNTAPSYSESAMGMYGTDYTPNSAVGYDINDRLFNLGNGTSIGSRSDAFTVYKSGNATLNGDLTVDNIIGNGSQLTDVDAGTVDGKDINDYLPLIGGTLTSKLNVSKDLEVYSSTGNPSDAANIYMLEASGTTWGSDAYGFRFHLDGSANSLSLERANATTTESILSVGRDFGEIIFNRVTQSPKTITDVLQLTPTTQPGSPVKGMVYYDSGTDLIRYYNGTTWLTL